MEPFSTAWTVPEELDHSQSSFSVFFVAVLGPFVAAMFALVVVLELFNVQYDRPLVRDRDRYEQSMNPVSAGLAYSRSHAWTRLPIYARHLLTFQFDVEASSAPGTVS